MSITQLMSTPTGNTLSKQMMIFIYDMVCHQEITNDDIESIKDYVGVDNKGADIVVDEMIKSCKIFKAKYMLMNKEMPPPDQVEMITEYTANQINPKVIIKELISAP